jgi:hypothetical protein
MTIGIRADHLLKLRATGHSCAEIGKLLSVSSQVVSYRLRQIKKRAAREGIENTFFSILNTTNIQDYYPNNASKESLTDVSLEGFGEGGLFEQDYFTNNASKESLTDVNKKLLAKLRFGLSKPNNYILDSVLKKYKLEIEELILKNQNSGDKLRIMEDSLSGFTKSFRNVDKYLEADENRLPQIQKEAKR